MRGVADRNGPMSFHVSSTANGVINRCACASDTNTPRIRGILAVDLGNGGRTVASNCRFKCSIMLNTPMSRVLNSGARNMLPIDFNVRIFRGTATARSLTGSSRLLIVIRSSSPLPRPII